MKAVQKQDNEEQRPNIPETRSAGITKRTALAQISNTSTQQITDNNSNSTNNSSQRLTAGQLTMRTIPRRDCFPRLQSIFIAFPTRRDVLWKIPGKLHNSTPNRDRAAILAFSGIFFLSPK
ncbi:hypothetical protein AVEN_192484-1 [Araneus ventricosus]|uniref:Uncharacterized protein n=1 Tax=Araneus ventricosus TaxID=182803 RepID=A0A4Y2UA49_ARAVE|nr:hypothetical protein AVEN_188731-1 [Araneus ventricosus]GBO08451.1 hypothetical protein AVEN_192484-1 [Araneus ventricosus]